MYLILYPFFAFTSWLMTVVTFVFAPLLALTADATGNLPKWLYWFQTFDNTLDAGWKVQGNYGSYHVDGAVPAGVTLWWYRTRWLWRNPAYGWDYWPLGVAIDVSKWTVRVNTVTWWIATGPHGQFCVRYLATKGVGLKLGWKAWAYWRDGAWMPEGYAWGPSRRAPLCLTL
ncbi:MAG: hypothetical protein VB131_06320 [Burkholderia gladioli]